METCDCECDVFNSWVSNMCVIVVFSVLRILHLIVVAALVMFELCLIKLIVGAKVTISGEWRKVMQKAVRWPCGVCGSGICNNSKQCTSQKWVHRTCSGMKGSMYKVMEVICL